MSVQAVRFNNCQLEYMDEMGRWHAVPTLNNCSDKLFIPSPLSQDKRARIAAYLTDTVLRRLVSDAIQGVSNPADIPALGVGINSFVVGIIGVIIGIGTDNPFVIAFGVSQGVLDLIDAIRSFNQGNAGIFEAAVNGSSFYDHMRCQLYCLIADDSEFTQATLDSWIAAIAGYTQASGAQSVIADNMKKADKYPLDFWKAAAFQGALTPTTFDPSGCDVCVDPYTLVTDYDNSQTFGSIQALGNRTFKLSARNPTDFDDPRGWRVLAKLPYLTRCAHLTITDINGFAPSDTLPFAKMYHCDDQSQQFTEYLANAGDSMPQSLQGICFTRLDLRSTTQFDVTVSIEPCCVDWRVDGSSGWIEVGQPNPANVAFDSANGLYGIDSGQNKTVAVYRHETRALPIGISFDVKYKSFTNPSSYTVLESDTVPTSINDGTPVDFDGSFHIITKPYVILKWNVTALVSSLLRDNDPNPTFQKFCYGKVGTCLRLLGNDHFLSLGKLQILPNAGGCTATYDPVGDAIQGCFNATPKRLICSPNTTSGKP